MKKYICLLLILSLYPVGQNEGLYYCISPQSLFRDKGIIVINKSYRIKYYKKVPVYLRDEILFRELKNADDFLNDIIQEALSAFPEESQYKLHKVFSYIGASGHLIPNCIDTLYQAIDEGYIKPEDARISFKITLTANQLEVQLEDNGMGIPVNLLDSWRQSYFTSSRGKGNITYLGGLGQGIRNFLWPDGERPTKEYMEMFPGRFKDDLTVWNANIFDTLNYEIVYQTRHREDNKAYQLFFPTPKERESYKNAGTVTEVQRSRYGTSITGIFYLDETFQSWMDGEVDQIKRFLQIHQSV